MSAFWVLLWLAGLPYPNVDDAFFFGAARHLAATGELANPWIVGWLQWIPGVHLDRFYVHPPFASYALAAWLWLFGASAAKVTAYAGVVGALAATGAARVLHALGCRWLACALGALLLTTYVLQRGLRPEVIGLALLLHGQAYMLSRRRRSWVAGCMLTLASPFCHAFLLTLAAPALLLQIWRRYAQAPAAFQIRATIAQIALSATAVAILFLIAIRGELLPFVHDFVGHARIVTPSADRLARFAGQLTVGWTLLPNLIALVTAFVLGLALARQSEEQRKRVAATAVAYFFAVGLGIWLYAPFTAVFAVLLAGFAALAWSSVTGGAMRVASLVPGFVVLAGFTVGHAAQFAANHTRGQYDARAIRDYVDAVQPEVVLLDANTLRYVFDFKPPPGTRERGWSWSPGLPDRWWSSEALEPRDLWVVNRHGTDGLKGAAPFQPPILFGREFRSVPIACQPIVIVGRDLPPPPAGVTFVYSRANSAGTPR